MSTIDDEQHRHVRFVRRGGRWVLQRSVIQDIRREHDEYLARHGGRRAVTPDSPHHRIQAARVREWRDRWDLIT